MKNSLLLALAVLVTGIYVFGCDGHPAGGGVEGLAVVAVWTLYLGHKRLEAPEPFSCEENCECECNEEVDPTDIESVD